MTNAKPKNIFKNRLNNYNNMDPVDAEFEEAMKQYEYKKRIAKAKNIHPYPVYNTEKSGWFTTVDDIRRPNGGFSGKKLLKMLPILKESVLHGIHIMHPSHCQSI